MKLRKLSAILLAGALMASPAVMPTVMAESSQTESSTQDIVDPSGYLEIQGTTVTGVTDNGKGATEIVIPDGVTDIGASAFAYCDSLKTVTIPGSVNYIDSWAFQDCYNLESVDILEGVTYIGDYMFYGCKKLETITIPNSVTGIGINPFAGTPFEEKIYEEKDTPVILGKVLFYGADYKGKYVVPDGVTGIYSSAFSNCRGLTSIVLPESLTTIGFGAFSGCTNLESVNIPEGITEIDSSTFAGCKNLTTISFPNSLSFIWDNAFEECTNIKDINYTGNEEQWKEITMGRYPRGAKSITGENYSAYLGDGPKDELDGKTPQEYLFGNAVVHYAWSFDENGLCIVDNVVVDCLSSAENVVIPKGITKIGENAFYNCKNLKSVDIPDTVTSIEDQAFSGCSNLKSIDIPDSVTKIGYCSFAYCTSLENIIVPESVTVIGSEAFRDCVKLASITLPKKINSYGYNIFNFCESLKSVTLPEGINELYDFYYCSSLESVVIPNSIGWIDQFTFFKSKLKDIYFRGTEEEWNSKVGNPIFFAEDGKIGKITMHYNYTDEEELVPVEFTDPSTGIKASADNGVIEDGAALSVKVVSNKTNATKSTFEISFMKDGKEVEPTGVVTVKLPVPETMKDKTIYVYRIEDDGTYTNMNATVEDGYAVFKTDHFSEYVLTTEKQGEEPADSSDSEESSDSETSFDSETTSDNSTAETETDSNSSNSGAASPETGAAGLPITLGVLAIASAAVVISRKKR